jgi:hypothetical protein
MAIESRRRKRAGEHATVAGAFHFVRVWKKVQFVAVSIDVARDREKIEPLLRHLNVDLDVWIGAELDTLEKFGLGNVVPGTVVIDEKGQAVTRVMGEARDEDVRTPLDWLIQGRIGPAPPPIFKRY